MKTRRVRDEEEVPGTPSADPTPTQAPAPTPLTPAAPPTGQPTLQEKIGTWMTGMQGGQAASAPSTATVLEPKPVDTDIKVPDAEEEEEPPLFADGETGAPVKGSRHINFSYLYGLQRGNAKRMAGELVAAAQKRARGARDEVAGAVGTFQGGLQAGRGSPYRGEYVPVQGMGGTQASANGQTGTLQQGLGGTPQKGPALPPGAITQQEAMARAGQKYTGPDGLLDFTGLLERTGKAQDFATGLADEHDRQGQLSDYLGALGGYGVNPAATGGKNRWTSALLGAAGGPQFDELAKRYGGLLDETKAAGIDAERLAKEAGIKTEEDAKLYQNAVDDYGALQDQENNRPAPTGPAPEAALPSWDEFEKGEKLTSMPLATIAGKDSKKVNEPRLRYMLTEWDQGRKVYDDLTPDEWARLLEMSPEEAGKYLETRNTEIDTWGPRKGRKRKA